MVPDRPLSVGCFQLPPEETDAGMAEGSATRLQDQKLYDRLEQWHLSERPPGPLLARSHAQLEAHEPG